MLRCHIAEWHDELEGYAKAGMPFRKTSVQEDPTWTTNVQLLASLLDADRRWTSELAAEVGVCHRTELHVVHDILGYRKLRRCNIGTDMQAHRPCWTGTKGNATIFLDE